MEYNISTARSDGRGIHTCTAPTDNGRVVIKDGVSTIAECAYMNEPIKEVTVAGSVKTIERRAFADCKLLVKITLPNGVVKIGCEAFSGCTSLRTINIPRSVTEIGDKAFDGCDNLMICVDENNSAYADVDGGLYTKDKSRLIKYCGDADTYTIPESVTEIAAEAFAARKSITGIAIPSGVTEIGNSAFICCESITSAVIPDGVRKIESFTFADCKSLTSIIIPASVKEIGFCAFFVCDSLKRVIFDGTKREWKRITINNGNEQLRKAKVIFTKHSQHARV